MDMTMTTQQINKAIDQEIWKMRDNEEAMRKMLDAARQIRILYVTPRMHEMPDDDDEQIKEQEAERRFRSLRGCWKDDEEDADRMEKAILENRRADIPREITLDD